MSEWPEGWYRDGSSGAPPVGGDAPAAGAGDPTVRLQAGSGQAGYGSPAPGLGEAGPGQGEPPPGGWPDQPPGRTGPGRGGPGHGGAGRSGWRRPRRWVKLIASLVVLILLVAVGLYFYLDSKLLRSNVLVNYSGRPAASAGTNWLISGAPGTITRKQSRQLRTGPAPDSNSDTIM